MRFKSFLFFLPVLAVIASGQSLSAAWESLLAKNQMLQAASFRSSAREAEYREACAAWWPRIDANASYQLTSKAASMELSLPSFVPGGAPMIMDKTLGDKDKMDASITATYPVFTGLSRVRHIEAKKAVWQASKTALLYSRNQLALQLGSCYAQLAMARLDLSLARKKVLARTRYLATRQTQVKEGIAISAQLYAAQADVLAGAADTIVSLRLIDSLEREFVVLTGSAAPDSIPLVSKIYGEETNLNAKQLLLQADAIDASKMAAWGGRLPNLMVQAGYHYANPGLNQTSTEWMGYGVAGVQLQWNLFDGGGNAQLRQRLAAEASALKSDAQQLLISDSAKLASLEKEQAALRAEKEAITAAIKSSKAACEVLKGAVAQGVALVDDWLDSELKFAELENRLSKLELKDELLVLKMAWLKGRRIEF